MGESYCSSIFLGIFCWERKKREKSVCLRQEKHENKGWFEVWDESLNTRRNEPNKMAEAIEGRKRIYKLDIMASDRGQNRYSDFVAFETLLPFENCSSSHCLLSSWRRFHVFESSHPSFHRTVFFGAPLAFLRGVAMGLCRRCVIFMSSCRRVFPTYLGRYLHKLYLPFFAWYLVTLLPCYPCYSVTLLLCPLVALSVCYPATLFPCSLVTLLSIF